MSRGCNLILINRATSVLTLIWPSSIFFPFRSTDLFSPVSFQRTIWSRLHIASVHMATRPPLPVPPLTLLSFLREETPLAWTKPRPLTRPLPQRQWATKTAPWATASRGRRAGPPNQSLMPVLPFPCTAFLHSTSVIVASLTLITWEQMFIWMQVCACVVCVWVCVWWFLKLSCFSTLYCFKKKNKKKTIEEVIWWVGNNRWRSVSLCASQTACQLGWG